MNLEPQDPLRIMVNIELFHDHPLTNQAAELGWLSTTAHDPVITIKHHGINLELSQEGLTVLLRGEGEATLKGQWLPVLRELLATPLVNHYQLDIYEEDGRLLERIQAENTAPNDDSV